MRFPKFLILLIFLFFGCQKSATNSPQIFLWAWERPENLDFIDTSKIGVAFLAQTLKVDENQVTTIPRRQPLNVPPQTRIIAVTRIETDKKTDLSEPKRQEILRLILATLEMKNVSGIQVDFDATLSEREFYRLLLKDLRQKLPPYAGLTMTALASWCVGDTWIKDLPVDEAIPMLFDMGADDKNIRNFLATGADWQEPKCRNSYGISTEEPLKVIFRQNRKFYLFTPNPLGWRKSDLERLPAGVSL